MRIAVPSDDGLTLSAHFGKCREFLIFEARDGQVAPLEGRPNAGCHGHGAGPEGGHAGMVEGLRDCQVVLCGGIGERAMQALRAAGIAAVRVEAAGNAQEIVAAFQAGALPTAQTSMCRCRH